MEDNNELDQFKWNYTKEIRKKLRVGSFILSQPFLKDPLFKKVVCLMCAHSRSEGSFGFILNRKTEFKIGEFIEELAELNLPVYYGGPVANDSLYFIHDNRLNIPDAQEIREGVFWGGDFKKMISGLLEEKDQNHSIKFILGYSGWDPGQLRKEIIEDSWIVCESTVPAVFSSSLNLWKEVMENLGSLYHHLANLPERPDLN